MTVSEYVDTLIAICEVDGTTTYVDALITAARTAVTAGAGTIGAISSGSANGKSFTREVQLSPAQTLAAALRAKRMYSGTEAPQVVLPDYSRVIGDC